MCPFRSAHFHQEVKKSDLMPWIEKIENKLPGGLIWIGEY
jgi:hypothetical protein